MASCGSKYKFVHFTFELTRRGDATVDAAMLSKVSFKVETDDAMNALESAAQASKSLLRGLDFKVKSVSVSDYGD